MKLDTQASRLVISSNFEATTARRFECPMYRVNQNDYYTKDFSSPLYFRLAGEKQEFRPSGKYQYSKKRNSRTSHSSRSLL